MFYCYTAGCIDRMNFSFLLHGCICVSSMITLIIEWVTQGQLLSSREASCRFKFLHMRCVMDSRISYKHVMQKIHMHEVPMQPCIVSLYLYMIFCLKRMNMKPRLRCTCIQLYYVHDLWLEELKNDLYTCSLSS